MAQARKPAGSPGSTGGQFEHDPKAGTADLLGLTGRHVGHIPWMAHLDHVDMSYAHIIVSDTTRLDGAKISVTAASYMEHPDGTPVDFDEMKRRGITELVFKPNDNDLLDFEDERYRKAWEAGRTSLEDLEFADDADLGL